MGLFDQFPYTNFHELNLDWILQALKELEHTIDQFVSINALKYADPIQWNITKQYEKNTIVIDPQSGTAYISVQPVPSGVALTNEDYWTVVFDLGQFVVRASKNFANTYEADTTLTATVSTAAGGWIIWGDTLYKALVNITAGDSYVIGGNIAHFTMEDIIGHLEDLTTTDKSNLVAAINEVVGKIGGLADLTTTDKSNLVAAINEVVASIAAEAQAREDADGNLSDLTTTDKSNLVAAINEVNSTGGGAIAKIGDLDDLTTTDKSTIVNAINEVDYNTDTKIGDLTILDTTDKSNLVVSINEVLSYSNYYNVKRAGVTNDLADAHANTLTVNSLLQEGKILFFPDGDYYFDDEIVIANHAGIIGESMRGTVFHAMHNGNGIIVDIDYQKLPADTRVYFTFVLRDIAIYAGTYPKNGGAGVRLRNYTWEVTANFDHATYASIKGDSYALEFRNSVCRNLYISGFYTGIQSGYYLAYGVIEDCFVETCTDYGVYNKLSDSIYNNIVITYCYNGMYEECEENKFNNICIKMNGYRSVYDDSHQLMNAKGLHCIRSKRDTFTNLEIQENYANGAVFENCHDMLLCGMVVDANGFSDDSGTSDIGVQILSGSYNFTGDITATNKNVVKSQRLGLYVADTCHDIQLRYQEEEQQTPIWHITNARRTQGALATTFYDRCLSIDTQMPNFVASPRAYVRYDGHTITIDIHGYFNSDVAANTVLANWTTIFNGAEPISGTSFAYGWTECLITNATDKDFFKAHILDCTQLVCDEQITSGKQIALTITVPVWLNWA